MKAQGRFTGDVERSWRQEYGEIVKILVSVHEIVKE